MNFSLNSLRPMRTHILRACRVAAAAIPLAFAAGPAYSGGLSDAMGPTARSTTDAQANEPIKQTGQFDVTFPLPAENAVAQMRTALYARFGHQPQPRNFNDQWPDATEEVCDFYVPKSYEPGGKPFALIVYIPQATDSSAIESWRAALDDRNVIWLGLRNLPSSMPNTFRTFIAIDMAKCAAARLTLDPDRIYVVGSGKGGITAADTALVAPDVFNGGVFCGQADCYKGPGTRNSFGPSADAGIVAKCVRDSRIVLESPKESSGGQIGELKIDYEVAGFKYFTYFEPKDPGSLGGEDFGKIIDDLDAPLAAGAEQRYKAAGIAEKSHRFGEALADYIAASTHGHGKPFAADADQKAAALHTQFDDDVQKIQTLIGTRKFSDALDAIRRLQSQWGPAAKAKSTDLMHQVAAARASK